MHCCTAGFGLRRSQRSHKVHFRGIHQPNCRTTKHDRNYPSTPPSARVKPKSLNLNSRVARHSYFRRTTNSAYLLSDFQFTDSTSPSIVDFTLSPLVLPSFAKMSGLKAGDAFPEGVSFSYVAPTGELDLTVCGRAIGYDASKGM